MHRFALCLAMISTPFAVQAQAPAAEPVEDADPPAAQGDPEAEAREAFREGSDAYAEARYGEAMRLFRRAYELSGRAALLYNIGLTADRLRDDAAAVDAFERYLASGEDARRDEVERRLAASRARLIASSVPDPVEPDPPPPLDAERPSRAGPWAVGLTGAALAVGGAVMLAVGARQVADVNDTPARTRDWSDVSGDASRGRTLSILGASLLAVGTAAGVVSVSWRLATPDRSGDAGPREQAVTVHFRGSF
jgi:tetratricopeptide (TPR) repeat protein